MPFPNVQLSNRPLHFIYLCDCSGSMAAQGKIQALNQAIRQSLPRMAEVAKENPEARVLVRAIKFSDQASWHISEPTPVNQLHWRDLEAGGITALGEALELLAATLQSPPMEERALPPVIVLISDGQPTDDFQTGLMKLMRQPWAQKAVRLAIALGHDADMDILQQFIGPEPQDLDGRNRSAQRPLQASNATTLAQYIQWASTAVVGAASMPSSQIVSRVNLSKEEAARQADLVGNSNIPMPDLPPTLIGPNTDFGPLVW